MHKGLVVNLLFLVVMIVSIILGEVLFPLEGVMGVGIPFLNDSDCTNRTAGIYVCVLCVYVPYPRENKPTRGLK